MSGFFGAPSMLWWGAAIAVPIAIHLLSRRRFRRVPWAAMELLERAVKKTRRRLRMENLLLLLLRILAVILIALALADPRIERGGILGSGTGGQVALVLVDTSFSMDARGDGNRSAFERAQTAASSIFSSLDPDRDAGGLLTTGRPAELKRPINRDIALCERDVEGLSVTASSTDLVGALKIAAGLLADPALETDYPGARIVYCITDLQKVPFLDDSGQRRDETDEGEGVLQSPAPAFEKALREIEDNGGRCVIVDVGTLNDDERRNVAVTSLRHSGRALVKGTTTRFECRVENFGRLDTGGELEFFIDQEKTFARRERIDVLAGKETASEEDRELVFNFDARFERAGWHYVTVRFRDDDLKIDNLRRFAFEVQDRIRVLAVNGERPTLDTESSAFFVVRALDPSLGLRSDSPFAVREIPSARLNADSLRETDILILSDVATIDAKRLRELESWVSEGGSLLYFPGPEFEVPNRLGARGGESNDVFFRDGKGLLPGRLVATRGSDEFTENPWLLQFETFDHPATRYFEDPRVRPGITRMPAHKIIEVAVDPNDEAVRILARFRAQDAPDGATWPALMERQFGEGRVVLFASSADRKWNLYGASPAFVPLIRETGFHLSSRSDRSNLLVGETLIERFPADVQRVSVARGKDPVQERATTLAPDKTSSQLLIPRLERAELIRLAYRPGDSESQKTKLVAVNVDPAESDLERAAEGWLSMNFGTELLSVTRDVESLQEAREGEGKTSLWRSVLWALLGVLGMETILAYLIGRKQRLGGAA